jgi:hypothetical protein
MVSSTASKAASKPSQGTPSKAAQGAASNPSSSPASAVRQGANPAKPKSAAGTGNAAEGEAH